jgi:hypothetical protein
VIAAVNPAIPPPTTVISAISSSTSDSLLSSGRGAAAAKGSVRVPDQLVLDAQRGDVLAMDALLERVLPLVMSISRRLGGPAAEDAAQDTLLNIFRNLQDLRRPEALASWVATIARREALRHTCARTTEPLPDELPATQPDDPLRLHEALAALHSPSARCCCCETSTG